MDTVNSIIRSRIMRAVPQCNTLPELVLRKRLHCLGFRYLLNDRRLPGSPDLVFPKHHAVIFVHGCFWHRHGCKRSTIPKTRLNFWLDKFHRNVKRDKVQITSLRKKSWRVQVVWECELKNGAKLERTIKKVVKWLINN
jgi:DNA mismatch endonuclease, patch repair protein